MTTPLVSHHFDSCLNYDLPKQDCLLVVYWLMRMEHKWCSIRISQHRKKRFHMVQEQKSAALHSTRGFGFRSRPRAKFRLSHLSNKFPSKKVLWAARLPARNNSSLYTFSDRPLKIMKNHWGEDNSQYNDMYELHIYKN